MRLLPLAFALLTPSLLYAAPLNCGAARSPREKLVCSSKDLFALDRKIQRANAALPAQLSPQSVALVRADQRDWLLWMDKICPEHNPAIQTESCLQTYYNERLDQLTKDVRRVHGILFYTRAHYVYVPGEAPSKDSNEAPFDPGFGHAAFAWPQIDSPDRDHAGFNQAAYQAAISTEASSEQKKKPINFEDGTSADRSIDAFTSVYAADEHIVDVDLSAERYEWGGAHPVTDRYSLLWSVALQRPLAPEDILRADTTWRTSLVEPAIAKLRKGDTGPNLWEGNELTDSVAAALANPQQWDLSRSGLTLTFAQYQVTCYACGTPDITFSWPELAPYLNPSFKPKQLPEQAPEAAE